MVRELADSIGDTAPDGRTVVIVLRGELIGAHGAFIERRKIRQFRNTISLISD